uniref:Uncharacterized protein n=1 Tax=Chaetoceros debilis TaxID=122233 RepID=A0A7S3Q1E3_9STRA
MDPRTLELHPSSAVTVTQSTITTNHPPPSASMNHFSLTSNGHGDINQAHQILEEHRKQQALLLLQQQQQQPVLLDKALSGLNPRGASTGHSLDPINDLASHANAGYLRASGMFGQNPVDLETRSILYLQEELKRQESRRKAEELLQQSMQEQAILVELQKHAEMQHHQHHQQQQQYHQHAAADQLLSGFSDLDHLVARQELLARLEQERRAALVSNAVNPLFDPHGENLAQGARHVSHAPGFSNHLNLAAARNSGHFVNQDVMNNVLRGPSSLRGLNELSAYGGGGQQQRIQSPLTNGVHMGIGDIPGAESHHLLSRALSNVEYASNGANHDTISAALHNLHSMNSKATQQQFQNGLPSEIQQHENMFSNDYIHGGGRISGINERPPNSPPAPRRSLNDIDLSQVDNFKIANRSSSDVIRGNRQGTMPKIRYFNNGAEVSKDGSSIRNKKKANRGGNAVHIKKRKVSEDNLEVISIDDDDEVEKKISLKPRINKKAKIAAPVLAVRGAEIVSCSESDSKSQVDSVDSLEELSNASRVRRCSLPKKNSLKLSQLVANNNSKRNADDAPKKEVEVKVNEGRSKEDESQPSEKQREEEKFDAANVLLGLMKKAA